MHGLVPRWRFYSVLSVDHLVKVYQVVPNGDRSWLILVDTSAKVVVTRSKPSDLPSILRAKRSEVQTITEEDVQQDATIRQTCEKCGQEEVRYYTQQLRSADEGSTVFYTCPNCGHKWNTNNWAKDFTIIVYTTRNRTWEDSSKICKLLVQWWYLQAAYASTRGSITMSTQQKRRRPT